MQTLNNILIFVIVKNIFHLIVALIRIMCLPVYICVNVVRMTSCYLLDYFSNINLEIEQYLESHKTPNVNNHRCQHFCIFPVPDLKQTCFEPEILVKK